MEHPTPCGALLVWPVLICLALTAQAQQVAPQDGTFHIERRAAFQFRATLKDDIVPLHPLEGALHVYSPVLPNLPGQSAIATRLYVSGRSALKSVPVIETSMAQRPMLSLQIKVEAGARNTSVPIHLEYQGTLYARTLKRARPSKPIPDLSDEEARLSLMATTTVDYGNPIFTQWMRSRHLVRRDGEDAMPFAHRVFTDFIGNAEYGGDTSNYESRRPSRVCQSFSNDCGGLALLFVAVMRANGVPARSLFGRWALSQSDTYGQYHVTAEFFVRGSGWVPVDISGTLIHKPKNSYALFGNTDGQFITFHVDTDLEPVANFWHAWAQYSLLKWDGAGDFWQGIRHQSSWVVDRKPAK